MDEPSIYLLGHEVLTFMGKEVPLWSSLDGRLYVYENQADLDRYLNHQRTLWEVRFYSDDSGMILRKLRRETFLDF